VRIRTTTGPGASPPPELHKSSNNQNGTRRTGTGARNGTVAHPRTGPRPLRPIVPIISTVRYPAAAGQVRA
jgi:hypothetical protein